jgi:DNA-nicking Smr family endonuclease
MWKQATAQDIPFHPIADAMEEQGVEYSGQDPHKSGAQTENPEISQLRNLERAHHSFASLSLGDTHHMDARSARRFVRGELRVTRVLDLHGATRPLAYSALVSQIHAMAASQERVLMVITGKGRVNDGVLKQSLPQWMNDASIRPHIVAAVPAPYHMGGEGAVLILIKRPRFR